MSLVAMRLLDSGSIAECGLFPPDSSSSASSNTDTRRQEISNCERRRQWCEKVKPDEDTLCSRFTMVAGADDDESVDKE